ELVGRHHDQDHDQRPREHHLGGEDLPAVVHDVADPGGHAEDLRDDRDLQGQPEADLHARDEIGDGGGDHDVRELLPAGQAIDVAHLQQAAVDAGHALDEVRG